MRVTDLRGRGVVWSFNNCRVLGDDTRPRSALHKRTRALLKQVFPATIIYEEVKIPGSNLRFDFVVPIKELVIEVQGEQHFKYVEYFHKSYFEYVLSRERDMKKVEFAQANDLWYVALPYNESDEEWRKRLENS